ncbi:hypothetical protein AMTR_s00119p00134240 [Amborella trichopoda]|uniref:Vacuolar protein-sorting-associated protein 36 n=1 Tax=Amborella trichopoda TaxID=13333 RepID=W1NNL2_AMBTC|nr:hypothetical protein AMTR_s00119p00134240 [Amborella trichopoda]
MEGKWSEFLFPASLTTSGRPVLQPGEVECSTLDSVDLELVQSPDPNTNFPTLRSGLLILTTFRFLFIDQNSRVSFSIPLSVVSHVSGPKKSIKSMFHSPRIRVRVSVSNDGRVAEKGQRFAEIVCVLRGKSDPDSFVGRLWEVLRSRPWESLVGSEDKRESEVGRVAESSSVWRPAMAGVSGILRKEQEQWESTDKSLQDAFQDLNALMSKAKEMVTLAEKMRLKLLAGPNSQNTGANEEEMGSKQEMQDWLLSVGIVSPVTKETAGAQYHQQLCRQRVCAFRHFLGK